MFDEFDARHAARAADRNGSEKHVEVRSRFIDDVAPGILRDLHAEEGERQNPEPGPVEGAAGRSN